MGHSRVRHRCRSVRHPEVVENPHRAMLDPPYQLHTLTLKRANEAQAKKRDADTWLEWSRGMPLEEYLQRYGVLDKTDAGRRLTTWYAVSMTIASKYYPNAWSSRRWCSMEQGTGAERRPRV